MKSTFPNQIDNIPLFLDVTERDGTLLKQFEEYMKNNDFGNANKVLRQIENADQKILSATRINKLRNCIIALEEFYGKNIKAYVNQKQAEWQSIIDNFKFVGDYNSNIGYKINNIVSYYKDGERKLYLRVDGNNIPNKLPLDEVYWRVLTVKGASGDSSSGETIFYFNWIPSQKYNKNSIVVHNNKWWISTNENIDSEPMEGSRNWKLIMQASQVIYPVSKEKPDYQGTGELWFEVI